MFLAILTLVAQVSAPPSPAAPVPSSTPGIAADPASLALSPAQQRSVVVTGATLPLGATLDRRLVTVTITGSTLTITATQATGTDTIHVTDTAGASLDVPVRVAFRAGTVVPSATLKVTGSPVDPQWLAREVASFVARLTTAMPGAQTTIAAVTPPPAPLTPGAQTQFDVPVQIAGAGAYYDVAGTTSVSVQNVPVAPFAAALLFYDDDPEHVSADGVLYRGTIAAARPARLYYYHDAGAAAHRIAVLLSVRPQDPSSVQVIDSTAGPNVDVMSVGHAATKNFLVYKAHNQGTVIDLDGEAPVIVDDVTLHDREGVAGAVGLNVLSGGPVTVTVVSVAPGADPRAVADGNVLPGDGHHRTGAFSLANYGSVSLAYQVGGADAKVVYGDREPTPQNLDPQSPGHDYGDYGVLWNIALTLANPTAQPQTVYLYERPIGGAVRSSFLIGDSLVEMGCARVSTPYQIAAYSLAASQTYRLNVETMTDGGSNYPLEVGVTQTPPEPSVPPIDAADGCFPK